MVLGLELEAAVENVWSTERGTCPKSARQEGTQLGLTARLLIANTKLVVLKPTEDKLAGGSSLFKELRGAVRTLPLVYD